MNRWWIGVSHLPMALQDAGFEGAAWCPTESLVARIGGVSRHYFRHTEANWHRE